MRSQLRSNLRDSPQLTGMLFVLMASLSLSIAPTLVKLGIAADAPIPLLSMRLIVASVALWLYILLYKPALIRITPHQLGKLMLVGLFNSISLTSFYQAVQYVDASIGVVMFALNPVVVLVILTFLGEPFTRRKQVRLLLALVGIILLVGIGGSVRLEGILWGLSVAVNYGIFLVLSQYLLKDLTARQIALFVVTTMALFLAVINTVGYGFPLTFTRTGWIVIVATGLISTALARLFLFAGIQRIGSGQTSLLGPLETLMAVTWATLFLGERLTVLQLIGGLLVLISAALVQRRQAAV